MQFLEAAGVARIKSRTERNGQVAAIYTDLEPLASPQPNQEESSSCLPELQGAVGYGT